MEPSCLPAPAAPAALPAAACGRRGETPQETHGAGYILRRVPPGSTVLMCRARYQTLFYLQFWCLFMLGIFSLVLHHRMEIAGLCTTLMAHPIPAHPFLANLVSALLIPSQPIPAHPFPIYLIPALLIPALLIPSQLTPS